MLYNIIKMACKKNNKRTWKGTQTDYTISKNGTLKKKSKKRVIKKL